MEVKTFATTQGRIVIPASLRRRYGIKVGMKIIVMDNDGEIILKPFNEQYLKRLQGSLKGTGVLGVLLEDHRSQEK